MDAFTKGVKRWRVFMRTPTAACISFYFFCSYRPSSVFDWGRGESYTVDGVFYFIALWRFIGKKKHIAQGKETSSALWAAIQEERAN